MLREPDSNPPAREHGTSHRPDAASAFPNLEHLQDPNGLLGWQSGHGALATHGQRRPILIVEDDEISRELLKETMSALGKPVLAAADGIEALALFEAHSPEVVISDWQMPRMDGVELCRALRDRTPRSPMHFIMLTAKSEKSYLLQAYEAGVDDFVAKPFEPDELMARARAGLRTLDIHRELLERAQAQLYSNAQLATMNSRLERLSITDELTGVYNRRHAMNRLEELWTQSERHDLPLSVAILDIDHFKRVNDTYGHDVGDGVLMEVAATLRDQLRGSDTLCRIGGEEFLIIFPMQSTADVLTCAERCRQSVQARTFHAGKSELTATISIGLASRHPLMPQHADLIKAADQALYLAKESGRNAIRTWDQVREQMISRCA